jgi:hypothetical protein
MVTVASNFSERTAVALGSSTVTVGAAQADWVYKNNSRADARGVFLKMEYVMRPSSSRP